MLHSYALVADIWYLNSECIFEFVLHIWETLIVFWEALSSGRSFFKKLTRSQLCVTTPYFFQTNFLWDDNLKFVGALLHYLFIQRKIFAVFCQTHFLGYGPKLTLMNHLACFFFHSHLRFSTLGLFISSM